ncbi:MAG: type II toxin-antitoxin system HicA family toxin [Candidatus Coatesbacteria bacterium]|nr:type II toxin-antitoxin system HicA family toxin [Candidatus Coatesbacteria bacterium]
MTAKEVEDLLTRYGFRRISQRGSHRKWRHPDSGLQVIVPEHRGRPLPMGTLRNILTNAEIPEIERR